MDSVPVYAFGSSEPVTRIETGRECALIDKSYSKLSLIERLWWAVSGRRPKIKNPFVPAVTYKFYSGCDYTFYLIEHLPKVCGEDPSPESYLEAVRGKTAIPFISGISFSFNKGKGVVEGTILSILSTESLTYRLVKEGDWDFVGKVADEYGGLSIMVLPNFRINQTSWGMGIDDLVTEENFTFSASEPGFLKKIR
jgi:hypothetical protein